MRCSFLWFVYQLTSAEDEETFERLTTNSLCVYAEATGSEPTSAVGGRCVVCGHDARLGQIAGAARGFFWRRLMLADGVATAREVTAAESLLALPAEKHQVLDWWHKAENLRDNVEKQLVGADDMSHTEWAELEASARGKWE